MAGSLNQENGHWGIVGGCRARLRWRAVYLKLSASTPSAARLPIAEPFQVVTSHGWTRLALASLIVSSANVLLLDEPTNNLDPASREEVLRAIRTYEGAIVLVSHDEGAARALEPDRVLLLPDGDEDLWSDDYADLVTLA